MELIVDLMGGLCVDVDSCLSLLVSVVTGQKWPLLAAILGVVALQVVKRFFPNTPLVSGKLAWIHPVASSVLLAVVAAWLAGQPVTLGLVLSALFAGLGAVGLFSATKNTAQALKAGETASSGVKTKADALRVFRGGSDE